MKLAALGRSSTVDFVEGAALRIPPCQTSIRLESPFLLLETKLFFKNSDLHYMTLLIFMCLEDFFHNCSLKIIMNFHLQLKPSFNKTVDCQKIQISECFQSAAACMNFPAISCAT